MEQFKRHQNAARMGGSIPRCWTQYCWQCFQLGALLSLVRVFAFGHPTVFAKHVNSYNMLKKRASGDDPNYRMSAGSYLLCSAQASSQSL